MQHHAQFAGFVVSERPSSSSHFPFPTCSTGQETQQAALWLTFSDPSQHGEGHLGMSKIFCDFAQLAVNAAGSIPADVLEQLAVGRELLMRGMHQLPGSANIPVPRAPVSQMSDRHEPSSFPVSTCSHSLASAPLIVSRPCYVIQSRSSRMSIALQLLRCKSGLTLKPMSDSLAEVLAIARQICISSRPCGHSATRSG